MGYIDVHCHLDICKSLDSSIEISKKKNISFILTAGVDAKSNRKCLEYSKRFDIVEACLGIYPSDGVKMSDSEIDNEIDFIIKNKKEVIGIGEIGLDLKDLSDLKRQKEIFEKFLDLALKIDKPVIIHSRKAELETITILENKGMKKVLMHCFSGNMNLVNRIISNNWFLSIPSNVKFSEHFQSIVRKVPIQNLLCETDSPFLHPNKERNNFSYNVLESYKKIAEIKNLSLKEVENQIEQNYKKLFL